ncbi:MAG TPA: hypothetical protein VMN79_03060 [Casimicrobiaceae bacterium]|nr:hypothetical protein [Casimicrobiaceae bacterium]
MSKLMIPLLVAAGVVLAGCATQQGPAPASSAAAEKRDRDYANALRKCDALGVAEREACIYDAKDRYDRS